MVFTAPYSTGMASGQCEEEQLHQLRQQQPRAQYGPVHVAPPGAAGRAEQENEHVAHCQHSQSGDAVAQELLRPGDGQRVQQTDGAGGHQIRPHRHSRQAAEEQRHDDRAEQRVIDGVVYLALYLL